MYSYNFPDDRWYLKTLGASSEKFHIFKRNSDSFLTSLLRFSSGDRSNSADGR